MKLTLAAVDIGPVRELPPATRMIVVTASLSFLFCSLAYAGVKLGPALRHRKSPPRPGRLI